MSGGKSGGKAAAGSKSSQSRSAKAGLAFPVGRVHRLLRRGNYAQRVGAGAPGTNSTLTRWMTNLQSTLPQSLSTSLLKSSSWLATLLATTKNVHIVMFHVLTPARIIPRHLQLAIRNDEELNKYIPRTMFAN
jgi:histone H2A